MQAKQKHRGTHAMYTLFCKRVQASEREMVLAFKQNKDFSMPYTSFYKRGQLGN